MELVRDDDGRVIQLREAQRKELGRGPGGGGAARKDEQSVSRRHALVELLRSSSRKGKEVVGEFPALRLYVRVVGKNPICCIIGRGGRGGGGEIEGTDDLPAQIKFLGRGEDEWLSTGDKVTLSIRRPSFWTLRPCSRSGQKLRGDDFRGDESLSSLRNAIPAVSSNLIGSRSPVEKDVDRDVEDSSPVDEEAEIAKAVERRQRRRLERDEAEQRKRLQNSEQQQRRRRRRSENAAELDNQGATNTNSEAHKEASVLKPFQQSNGLPHPFDPVSEFGFVVEGAEFQSYEKRNKTAHPGEWSWSLDKVTGGEEGVEDGAGDRNAVQEHHRRNNGTSVKNCRSSGEEEEKNQKWGGDSKEEAERIAKVAGNGRARAIPTRSNRRQKADNRSGPATLTRQHHSKGSSGMAKSKDKEDLSDFIVSDDDSMEEGGDSSDFIASENDSMEEDDEDDDEIMDEDDDEPIPHQKAKGSAQKPVCKYGSKCYRGNQGLTGADRLIPGKMRSTSHNFLIRQGERFGSERRSSKSFGPASGMLALESRVSSGIPFGA